jgi:hypothetical protein
VLSIWIYLLLSKMHKTNWEEQQTSLWMLDTWKKFPIKSCSPKQMKKCKSWSFQKKTLNFEKNNLCNPPKCEYNSSVSEVAVCRVVARTRLSSCVWAHLKIIESHCQWYSQISSQLRPERGFINTSPILQRPQVSLVALLSKPKTSKKNLHWVNVLTLRWYGKFW